MIARLPAVMCRSFFIVWWFMAAFMVGAPLIVDNDCRRLLGWFHHDVSHLEQRLARSQSAHSPCPSIT